jgi:hypothetical protein
MLTVIIKVFETAVCLSEKAFSEGQTCAGVATVQVMIISIFVIFVFFIYLSCCSHASAGSFQVGDSKRRLYVYTSNLYCIMLV